MKPQHLLPLTLVLVLLLSLVTLGSTKENATRAGTWLEGETYDLKGLRVTLSAPALVKRSRGFYWFPRITRLSNGSLVTHVSLDTDTFGEERGEVLWSSDGGLTWGNPKQFPTPSSAQIHLPSGDLLSLPYRLYPRPDGMGGPYNIIPNGKREIKFVKGWITVIGWPRPSALRPEQAQYGQDAFSFEGQPVRLKDGKYLVTLSGFFEQANKKKFKWLNSAFRTLDGKELVRYSVVAAESEDGFHWKVRSVVADENCKLEGNEGPNEATLCCLKDGHLMCVFRLGPNKSGYRPYGQSWSSDEGKTWTEPISMRDVGCVSPRIAVMKDGTVVLSGGRPDLYLWFNADGTGKDWQRIDTLEHHNVFHPQEKILRHGSKTSSYYFNGTSTGYTDLIAVDDTHLLYVYDRTPLTSSSKSQTPGKDSGSEDLAETYSVWVVRITLKRS